MISFLIIIILARGCVKGHIGYLFMNTELKPVTVDVLSGNGADFSFCTGVLVRGVENRNIAN